MSKKSKDNTEINTSRRSSAPDNSKNKIHTLAKRQNTDETNQSYKIKPPKILKTFSKTIFKKKKDTDENDEYNSSAPSSSDEVSKKEESFSDSTVSECLDKISEFQDEIIDELKITFDIKITNTRDKVITLKTIIIEKNNSEALTAVQTNAIAETGIIHTVLTEISNNEDEDPIRIVYTKHTIKNLNDFSVKMYEKININNQGDKVVSHANYDLNELKALINSRTNDVEAINIINVKEFSSPDVSFTALPFIDSDGKKENLTDLDKLEVPTIDINEHSPINISGDTLCDNE